MSNPVLRFTPYAWAKLIWFRDHGKTEIGGFGLTTEEDPLFVYDIAIPNQEVSSSYVEFDDVSVADHFEDMFDFGIQPINCGRIWIHTHPVGLAQPSGTDKATFSRVFGSCDWAVMFILPKGGGHYCKLNFNKPIPHSIEIPYRVDYNCDFDGSDAEEWKKVYAEKIKEKVYLSATKKKDKDLSLTDYLKKYSIENKKRNPYSGVFMEDVEKRTNSEKKGLYSFEEDDEFLYNPDLDSYAFNSEPEEELFKFSAPVVAKKKSPVNKKKSTVTKKKKGTSNGKKTKIRC